MHLKGRGSSKGEILKDVWFYCYSGGGLGVPRGVAGEGRMPP